MLFWLDVSLVIKMVEHWIETLINGKRMLFWLDVSLVIKMVEHWIEI